MIDESKHLAPGNTESRRAALCRYISETDTFADPPDAGTLAYMTGMLDEKEAREFEEKLDDESLVEDLREWRDGAGDEETEIQWKKSTPELAWAAHGAADDVHTERLTFAVLNAQFAALPRGRVAFVASLMRPDERLWFRASHALVHGETGVECSAEMLAVLSELPEEQAEAARLHCAVARVLRASGRSVEIATPALDALATGTRSPRGLVFDIAQELQTDPHLLASIIARTDAPAVWHGDLRPAESEATALVIMVARNGNPDDEHAVLAQLTIEIVSKSKGPRALCLHPVPTLALMAMDDAVRKAVDAAVASALPMVAEEVAVEARWRLASSRGNALPANLCGPSLGLALAFLLQRLLAAPGETIARVNLAGIAFTGAIDARGFTQKVGGMGLKPYVGFVHTIVMPCQVVSVPGAQRVPEIRSPHASSEQAVDEDSTTLAIDNHALHILRAHDVNEAADLIAVDYENRWKRFDFAPPEVPAGYVGRERLLAEVRSFIEKAESGYGVVVGGMGVGKTSFMGRLVNELIRDGVHPGFHFVPVQGSREGRGNYVGEKFYHHLRRIHVSPEPIEWAGWDIRHKIEEFLQFLSPRIAATGEKVVLVLDGGNEIEMPNGQRFVPDILPAHLPPGVICIVSSWPDVEWLKVARPAFFAMREKAEGQMPSTDDRVDVRRFIEQYEGFKLKPAFIDRIMSLDVPPVFFTVATQLAELADDEAGTRRMSAGRRQDYLTKPDLWVSPPRELIERRISMIRNAVDTGHLKEEEIRNTLGVLAMAREPMSKDMLRDFGLWNEGFSDSIVTEASSFFLPRNRSEPRSQQPFRFEHPGYLAVIGDMLEKEGRDRCHRLLGEACLRWRAYSGASRDYALRHGPAHLRRAGNMWRQLHTLFTDFDYLEEKMTPPPAAESGNAECPSASRDSRRPLVARVIRDFDLALHNGERAFPGTDVEWRPSVEALFGTARKWMHALCESPELLVQQLYNGLAWEWDETTTLGKNLRSATERSPRIVLLRLNPPVVSRNRVERHIFSGHRRSVNAVALSPDETIIASASDDLTVNLWKRESGEIFRVLRGHAKPVRTVSWRRDGKMLASTGGAVRLWDPASSECVRVVPGSEDSSAAAFSPTDDLLAVAGNHGSLRLFNNDGTEVRAQLRERGPRIRCIAFSPDGNLLAIGTGAPGEAAGTVDVYDARQCRHLRTVARLGYWVAALAFTHDSKTLVSGGGADLGEIQIFEAESGKFLRRLPLHRGGVRSIAVTPEGTLVTGSYDLTINVRDLASGALLCPPMGHADVVNSVATSRDRKVLISGGADHTVIEWQVGPRRVLGSQAPVESAATEGGHEDKINATRFMADGSAVSTASRDGSGRLFPAKGGPPSAPFLMDRNPANVAAASPDGTMLAVGSMGNVKIFDVATGALLRVLQGHKSWVLDLAWTSDSRHIVTVSEDTTAMIFDAATGNWRHVLSGHTARLRAVAISPDDQHAATAGDDGRIHIWHLEAGTCVRTLLGHDLRVKALAWSRNGLLASAGSDDFIKLWDPIAGTDRGTLAGLANEIWALRFSPDGRFLAVGGVDGMARLFDLVSMHQVACLPCEDAVQALWFSEDGTEFRVADRGGVDLVPNIYITRIVFPLKR